MEKKRHISLSVWPLYIWTVLFVALPLVYVVVISFLQRGDTWGVTDQVTIDNYVKMVDPMYGSIFLETLAMAVLTTALTFLFGYPFAYYVCKLPARRGDPAADGPLLDQLPLPPQRLDDPA